MSKRHHYFQRAGELNRTLKSAIPSEILKELHRKNPVRHLLIAGRQLGLLIILPLIIYHFQQPLIWVPASILLGFVIFSFSVLLHEAVHKCIFNKDQGSATLWLGRLYSVLSGLSYSQFRRWHLDHHNELGSETEDPKRAHLSPKRNARWYKLLYCTPALFYLYFSAAAREQKKYPSELRARIKRERLVAIAFYAAVLAVFWGLSPWFALKAFIAPVFFVFPVAFTVNRIGQHYVIDPHDVAKWSTLMRPNAVWNFLFLYSSYHLEHHYFPAVPFYKLKRLQKALDPFYQARGVPAFSYSQLLKSWFWDNHEPHTKWKAKDLTPRPVS